MKTVCLTTRVEWREWLAQNHGQETEIWLVFYKKHTGRPALDYDGDEERRPTYHRLIGDDGSRNVDKMIRDPELLFSSSDSSIFNTEAAPCMTPNVGFLCPRSMPPM